MIILATVFADIPVELLLTRMVATAIIVIGVALVVGRLGPVIGGVLAGLPIVFGPGFYFLVSQASPTFVLDAASASLLTLCATQIFLLAFVAIAQRATPLGSLMVAVSAWLVAASLLAQLPPRPVLGLTLFLAVTFLARKWGSGFIEKTAKPRARENFGLLLMRGLIAGVLVAIATVGASRLGPVGSGMLLAFPIGYSVISITLHEQFGAATAAGTLYSAILGTISLAAFCATLAFTVAYVPPFGALAGALAMSVIVTLGLVGMMAPRKRL